MAGTLHPPPLGHCCWVNRESLSPLNHWVFLLHSSFSFHFFILKVRFVFITHCLSLDWTDLLSKTIQCPIANVLDASSIAVTDTNVPCAPADVSQHTLLISVFFSGGNTHKVLACRGRSCLSVVK